MNNLDIVLIAYADIYTSRFYSNAATMTSLDSVNAAIDSAAKGSLLLFYGNYSIFDEDAIEQNLLQYSGEQLFDVANRTQSPYIPQKIFAAYPNQNFFNGTVLLRYKSSLFYTNAGVTIQSLNADFGNGWQTLANNDSTSYTYTDSSGFHIITLKAVLSNNDTLYTKMLVWVDTASNNQTARYPYANLNSPDIDITPVTGVHSGCQVYIRRSLNTIANASSGQLLKPLIVVEGLDIHSAAPHLQQNYQINKLLDEWGKITFGGMDFSEHLDDVAGYDLVFIDWKNGVDDITRNAALLKDVIGRINNMKATGAGGDIMVRSVTNSCPSQYTTHCFQPCVTWDNPNFQ